MHFSEGREGGAEPGENLAMLADEALQHAKELVRAELSLAKLELHKEAKAAAFSAACAVLALVLLHAGFLVLVAAVVLALFAKPLAAASVGVVLIAAAAGAAFAALHAFKRRHLPRTRARLSRDAHALMRFKHE